MSSKNMLQKRNIKKKQPQQLWPQKWLKRLESNHRHLGNGLSLWILATSTCRFWQPLQDKITHDKVWPWSLSTTIRPIQNIHVSLLNHIADCSRSQVGRTIASKEYKCLEAAIQCTSVVSEPSPRAFRFWYSGSSLLTGISIFCL